MMVATIPSGARALAVFYATLTAKAPYCTMENNFDVASVMKRFQRANIAYHRKDYEEARVLYLDAIQGCSAIGLIERTKRTTQAMAIMICRNYWPLCTQIYLLCMHI